MNWNMIFISSFGPFWTYYVKTYCVGLKYQRVKLVKSLKILPNGMSNRTLNKPMCTIVQWNGMVFSLLPTLCFLKITCSYTPESKFQPHPYYTLWAPFAFLHPWRCFLSKMPLGSFFPLGLTCTFLNALSFNFPRLNIHLWPTRVTINIVIGRNMNIDNYIIIVCWWCTNAIDTCIDMNVLELETWIVMHVIFL